MNDKCSAGTGKFLEVIVARMGLNLSEIYSIAKENDEIKLSSTCTVFAESEIISMMANGVQKEFIAYAIIDSSAKKAVTLGKRLASSSYFLSGGLSKVGLFVNLLKQHLDAEVIADKNAIYCGAMGASLMGEKNYKKVQFNYKREKMSFADLKQKNTGELASLKEKGVKIIETFCTYAPKDNLCCWGVANRNLCV